MVEKCCKVAHCVSLYTLQSVCVMLFGTVFLAIDITNVCLGGQGLQIPRIEKMNQDNKKRA